MHNTVVYQQSGFLRLPEVLKLIPVSKATWWNGCKSGRFPKPYKIALRVSAWKADEIQKCMDSFEQSCNITENIYVERDDRSRNRL